MEGEGVSALLHISACKLFIVDAWQRLACGSRFGRAGGLSINCFLGFFCYGGFSSFDSLTWPVLCRCKGCLDMTAFHILATFSLGV
ncbi:hypothetical protein JYG34_09725 [Pseudomonas entomophila]|uniref:hypothetical protein n=1 Tax=Pseudomonas entomophila TaxID=312306 RepID=UPI001BCF5B85|nr:hypothetical protein [Pseudomonas entomophila]QVM93265.1 hypothetical protein JYG34_09725 [Pseudomonas entomophila]